MRKWTIIVAIAGLLTAGSVVLASDGGTITDTSEQRITMHEAKEIALAEVDGEITSAELDEEKGRSHYDIDIFDGTYEYEFEIDVETGEIIEFEKEIKKGHQSQETATMLSEDEALAIAFEKAPGATVKEIEFEQEKGWNIYDIELMDGQTKYEMDIDAVTGEILEYEKDEKKAKKDTSAKETKVTEESKETLALTPTEEKEQKSEETKENSTLTAEEAIAIARQHATGVVTEIERDDDVFEIELEDGDIEYEIEIDIFTGK